MQEKKQENIIVNKEELKKRLTPLQWEVTQNADTEKPFTSKFDKHTEKGVYQCICCFTTLFSSSEKFDALCGWPAFFDGIKDKIVERPDNSIQGRPRTEVLCKVCNSHLGHVFNDGPKPTGIRYCINGASMHFVPAEEKN